MYMQKYYKVHLGQKIIKKLLDF